MRSKKKGGPARGPEGFDTGLRAGSVDRLQSLGASLPPAKRRARSLSLSRVLNYDDASCGSLGNNMEVACHSVSRDI